MLVTLCRALQLVLSKTIRIGDTKHHIQCSEGGNYHGGVYLGAFRALTFLWDSHLLDVAMKDVGQLGQVAYQSPMLPHASCS